MRLFRHIAWLAPVLCALPGCYPTTGTGPQEPTLRRVEVIKIRHQPVADTLSLIGTTEPWQEAVLYFEVAGVVGDVLVEEGDRVEAGDPIARLVLDDYNLALARAEAQRAGAQAALDLLRAGTRQEDLEAARADYAGAKARADYWSNELIRVRGLYQRNVIALSQLEQVRREHDAVGEDQRAAKARWDRAVAGPRKEEIQAAEAELDARTQAAALAQRQLDKATLRAPFAGRIEKRMVDTGAYVNVFPTGGVPILHLVDLSKVDALVAVPEKLRTRVADATHLEIRSAVDPQIRAAAGVVSLDRIADRASGSYQLRARLSNPQGRFTGRMVVTAAIAGRARSAVQIPLSAVRSAYGRPPYVLLVDPKTGRVAARQVQLGPIAGQHVEVSGGLSGGELMIVGGHDRIVQGDHVQGDVVQGDQVQYRPPKDAPAQRSVP